MSEQKSHEEVINAPADTGADPCVEANAQPTEDWKDRYIRLLADFENARKRSSREFGELIRNAERELINELTEVYDDFIRAYESDHKGESVEHFAQGVSQIGAKFWRVLEKRGLERLKTVGEPFNPEEHDALMRTPSNEYEPGVVMQEIAPGYRLGGKILRHAKVVVAQENPEANFTSEETED